MGGGLADSGHLLADHAHWHRDPLKWRVCLCRSGDAYAPVPSAHIAWHITLPFHTRVRDRGHAGHRYLFQPVRSSNRADCWAAVMLWFSWVPSSKGSTQIWPRKFRSPISGSASSTPFLSTVSGAGGLLQSLMVNSKLAKREYCCHHCRDLTGNVSVQNCRVILWRALIT